MAYDDDIDEEAQMKYEPWFLYTVLGIGALHIVVCAVWLVKNNKKLQ
jgi:hypothetical protein